MGAPDIPQEVVEDGWLMAVRLISAMIEHRIPPSQDKDHLLRHIKGLEKPMFANLAMEQLKVRLGQAEFRAARMAAALRRYEPDNADWWHGGAAD